MSSVQAELIFLYLYLKFFMIQKQSQKKIDSLKNNKKLRVFLFFLTMSFLFWMLIKLSEEYIADVRIEVNYIDIPAKKLLQSEPLQEIILTLKTRGFILLRHKIKEKKINYSLKDIKHKRNSIYFSETSSNINSIQAQFSAETDLLKIKPDTLYFDFGKKFSKKVKVVSDINLHFKSGFNLVNDIVFKPDFITISGPKGIIDSILEIKTKSIDIEKITESFEKSILLIVPDEKVSLSVNHIVITGKVDKFTEGTFMMPFEVINVPKASIISTYPKEVKIVFQVALSDYNKIVPESFKVICDFKESQDNSLDHLMPKIIEQPEMITSVKIIPNKIEYLIKK